MASTSEVGHSKNVANFNTLYQILEEMGTLYNPTNTSIKLVNLIPIKTTLAATMDAINLKNPIYKKAVAAREILIMPLSKTVTKSVNSFNSLSVSAADKENILSLAKKIRGDKKKAKPDPDKADADSISTSQMSYDSRIANFASLIAMYKTFPEYVPNETPIKTATLQAFQQSLAASSSTVNIAGNQLLTARSNRDKILYKDPINVIELQKDIKSYLKSLGEAGLPYYKAAVKLKFKDN